MVTPKNLFIFDNLRDLAEYLGISERQVRRLKAAGLPQRPDGSFDGFVCKEWKKNRRKSQSPAPRNNNPEEDKRQLIYMIDDLADELCLQALKQRTGQIPENEKIINGEAELCKFIYGALESAGFLDLVKQLEITADRIEEELGISRPGKN